METKSSDMSFSKQIAECYQNIYEEAEEKKALGSVETVQKIVSVLGEEGYTAIDIDNKVDMVNSEKLIKFCEQVEEKKKSETTLIAVMYNGGFIQYDLSTSDGKVNVVRSVSNWKGNIAEVDGRVEYSAYTWKYACGDYLFFEQYHPPGFDGPSGHTAVRIKPLDKKCRELYQKYLDPISYNLNNMFTTDWDENDFCNLNFYDLYECMYQMKYGKPVIFDSNNTGKIYEISKGDFESVFMKYFKIEGKQLQENTKYSLENGMYEYKPRGLYDYAPTPNIPYPEVVDYQENSDGTIKLTVNAVWPEENMESAFSHEVTIRPIADGGFQYVSNHIIPSDKNVEPTWYTERLTDEEWEKYYEGIK